VYSSQLGAFPECKEYRSSSHCRDERQRVETLDTAADAIAFVGDETELTVPERPD